jgi:hypothetical protein
MNLTSSSFDRRRQFCTVSAQPLPVSPRPWTKMTVAVCRLAGGNSRGGKRFRALMVVESDMTAWTRLLAQKTNAMRTEYRRARDRAELDRDSVLVIHSSNLETLERSSGGFCRMHC